MHGRASSRLLRFALMTSALILTVGQWLMWSLHTSSFDESSAVVASAAQAGVPITVAVGRTPGGPSEWTTYAAVLGELQKDLGRPVKVRYALTRPDITRVVLDREADLAFVPTWVYLITKDEGAAQLVAAPIVSGTRWESAALVVSASSDISSIDDLRGKRVLLFSDSLPGEAFLYWLFDQRAEDPHEHFSAVIPGGTQEQNLADVFTGRADATLVNRSSLARWPAGTFRIVVESPEFATPPLVARADLDSETLAAVRESVLRADKEGVIDSDSSLDGFSVVTDEDYAFSRELARYVDESALRLDGEQGR